MFGQNCKTVDFKIENSNQSQFPSTVHFPIKPFIYECFFTDDAMEQISKRLGLRQSFKL